MVKTLLFIFGKMFQRIFKTNSEVFERAQSDIFAAAKAVMGLSGEQIRDFLAAVPIFLKFVTKLVERRHEFGNKAQLLIVGAGVVLGSLPIFLTLSVIGSLPFQIFFIFANPALGIPLFVSTQAFMCAATVFLTWIVIFVLNSAFSDNPVFQEVRDEFLSPNERDILNTVQEVVQDSGAEIDKLSDIVSEGLGMRGERVDPEKIEVQLDKVNQRVIQRSREVPSEDDPRRMEEIELRSEQFDSAIERLHDKFDHIVIPTEVENPEGQDLLETDYNEDRKKQMKARGAKGRANVLQKLDDRNS
jgi:hypothetical protein